MVQLLTLLFPWCQLGQHNWTGWILLCWLPLTLLSTTPRVCKKHLSILAQLLFFSDVQALKRKKSSTWACSSTFLQFYEVYSKLNNVFFLQIQPEIYQYHFKLLYLHQNLKYLLWVWTVFGDARVCNDGWTLTPLRFSSFLPSWILSRQDAQLHTGRGQPLFYRPPFSLRETEQKDIGILNTLMCRQAFIQKHQTKVMNKHTYGPTSLTIRCVVINM